MADVEASQVTLKLTTQLPARLRVPPTALAVPARLTRYGLSEVVNSLLALGARLRNAPASASWSPALCARGRSRRHACSCVVGLTRHCRHAMCVA